ncbi:MAG TPA: tetratricopeptide repeat protein, partial [Candidatus Polarisedimenticolia bacterium]|nr:tetratricopeptide repeat protein [Candidatus Polarisedimenticolia bacterium]
MRARNGAWILALAAVALLAGCTGTSSSSITPKGGAQLEAQEHYQRGMELVRQGQDQGAEAEFRRTLDVDPEDPKALLQMGKILAARARQENKGPFEAVELLNRAVKEDPKDIQARFELAEILKERYIDIYDPDRTVELYESILKDNPSLAGVRLRYATWLAVGEVRLKAPHKEGRVTLDSAWTMDTARSHLERVLDEVPPDSDEAAAAHLTMANVLMKSGAWPELVRESELFLTRYPNAPQERIIQAMGMKAQGLFRQKLFKEAIAVYRQTYDLEPGEKPLWGIHMCTVGLGGEPKDLPAKYHYPLRPESTDPSLPPPPKFRDIAPELGIAKVAGAGPAGWADYDGDGRYDLVACGMDTFCSLFHNEGKKFRDVTL